MHGKCIWKWNDVCECAKGLGMEIHNLFPKTRDKHMAMATIASTQWLWRCAPYVASPRFTLAHHQLQGSFIPTESQSFDQFSKNLTTAHSSRRSGSLGLRRKAGMAVAGMLGQALKGAAMEVRRVRAGPVHKVVMAVTFLLIIVREVLGTVKLAPYGLYALCVYTSLLPFRRARVWKLEGLEEKVEEEESGSNRRWLRPMSASVVVARNVCYGDAERNLLDIYVPNSCTRVGEDPKPVIVFVHGGVWASGDKWQFSPLGVFLAEQGVIAVLVQYTLFPQVLAIDQVSEVSQALSWTMDNIEQYCGNPNCVYLMGHSSGAHLASMVLWERARRRLEKLQRPISEELDIRNPCGFLGLAGVYNIGEHFKWEVGRGVGAISCMRPANGGEEHFDDMSPSLLFESLLVHTGMSFVKEFTEVSSEGEVKGVDLVPPCLFLASHQDTVVPPTSSFAFHCMLQSLCCESQVILHDSLNHEDFVLLHKGWGTLKPHIGPYVEDILNFISNGMSEVKPAAPEPASAPLSR